MDFKSWKIKVKFHELEYDSILDERHELKLMEVTLTHLIQHCDFMPRVGDIISDVEGLADPFIVELIAFNVDAKVIEFILTDSLEDD